MSCCGRRTARAGEERGSGLGYCCKWVLTVSNSGGELGVKVLGRVT